MGDPKNKDLLERAVHVVTMIPTGGQVPWKKDAAAGEVGQAGRSRRTQTRFFPWEDFLQT